MEESVHPVVRIGDLTLMEDHFFQVPLDGEAVISLQPTGLSLVFRLDKAGEGKEVEVTTNIEDDTQLVVSFKNTQKLSSIGFGTTRPLRMGTLQGRPLFYSFRLERIGDDMAHANVALYTQEVNEGSRDV